MEADEPKHGIRGPEPKKKSAGAAIHPSGPDVPPPGTALRLLTWLGKTSIA